MRHLFPIFLSLLLSMTTYARKFPGYYIDLNGNKIETVFKVRANVNDGTKPDYARITSEITYFDSLEKKVLTAFDCNEIGFYLAYETVVLHSKSNRYYGGPGKVFLRTRLDGPATLYYYFYTQNSTVVTSSGSMIGASSEGQGWIIEKNNGQTLTVTYGSARRNDLAAFFYDFEDLSNKILNKDKSINIKDTEALVKIYNDWKLQHETEAIELNDTINKN